MKLRRILKIVISLLIFSIGKTQEIELNVGDKVPDIYFGKFLGDSTKKLKLSELRGKLLI